MTYYILLPDDNNFDALGSQNVLGEESFGSFYPEQGFKALFRIVDTSPELLSDIQILNDRGVQFTLTEFLDKLNSLSIKKM